MVHPSYSPPEYSSSKEHDIALLKLLHPVKLSTHAGLACLPPEFSEPPVGTLCTVTGWGHLEHRAGWSPELLHMAQVPLVSYRYVIVLNEFIIAKTYLLYFSSSSSLSFSLSLSLSLSL